MYGAAVASRVLLVVTSTVTILLSGCASISPLARLEQKMVYQPVRYPDGNWGLGGQEFQDAWFTADDGTQLHGWFSPHPRPRAVALFCHGNAGNLLGRSLGGGVAVQLAADDGARGLILASTFTSLPDVGAEHAPLLAPKLIMRNRFDSITRIPEYDGPLLMSHGDADELIPFEQGRQLFEAATGPKRFIRIPDAGHNDPQTEAYREAFDQFLTDLPPMSRPPRM